MNSYLPGLSVNFDRWLPVKASKQNSNQINFQTTRQKQLREQRQSSFLQKPNPSSFSSGTFSLNACTSTATSLFKRGLNCHVTSLTLRFPGLELKVSFMQNLELAFQEKKSQSQNLIQHFEFSRTFFSSGSRAIAARWAEWQAYQSLKKVRENSKCCIKF